MKCTQKGGTYEEISEFNNLLRNDFHRRQRSFCTG